MREENSALRLFFVLSYNRAVVICARWCSATYIEQRRSCQSSGSKHKQSNESIAHKHLAVNVKINFDRSQQPREQKASKELRQSNQRGQRPFPLEFVLEVRSILQQKLHAYLIANHGYMSKFVCICQSKRERTMPARNPNEYRSATLSLK
jgi:hypothetical protein